MTPYATADVYLKKPILIVRLRDVFAEMLPEPPKAGAKTRMRLIQRGQYMTDVLPNGLPVRVEHRRDGTWWFIIPNIATYPLVVEPMPIPKRRLIWSDGRYHLPFGMRQPVRFFIRDSLGKKVRNLYAIEADEISDHGTTAERAKRRADKVRRECLQADAIFGHSRPAQTSQAAATRKMATQMAGICHARAVRHHSQRRFTASAIGNHGSDYRTSVDAEKEAQAVELLDRPRAAECPSFKTKRRRQELEIEPPLPIHDGSL
jgi:hypothetical protein